VAAETIECEFWLWSNTIIEPDSPEADEVEELMIQAQEDFEEEVKNA
jgi:hypothetical protein